MENQIIRPRAEDAYADELKCLLEEDLRPKPQNWVLSPWAVLHYLIGGKTRSGRIITPKYIGSRKLLEMAIASLMSDRALLLTGVPGTAKSWLAEHLAAAISGHSSLLVQGTSGTNEDALRYGWDYAQLIAKGPSESALVRGPVLRAMERGQLVRIEELSRIPTETQDALISILSEKTIPVPELNLEVQARAGFNVIATANEQDKGIYPISSALMRRFNRLVMPLPERLEDEVNIVQQRVEELEKGLRIPLDTLKQSHLEKMVTIFRELRSGLSTDGKQKIKSLKSGLSPAEIISMVHQARIQKHYFSDQEMGPVQLVQSFIQSLQGSEGEDLMALQEYAEIILKKRPEYKVWYEQIRKEIKEHN